MKKIVAGGLIEKTANFLYMIVENHAFIDGNTGIKQIGINSYYEEGKNTPHYI